MHPLLLFALLQCGIGAAGIVERRQAYTAAREAADNRGLPLLNIGCPSTHGAHHPCGDVCLDLDPARLELCQSQQPTVGSVTDIPFPDGTFGAALCAHVLEHLATPEDVQTAMAELSRVADAVYICVPPRANVVVNNRWLYPEHHLLVEVWRGQVTAVPL